MMKRILLPLTLIFIFTACVFPNVSIPVEGGTSEPVPASTATPNFVSQPVTGTNNPSDFTATEILGRPTDVSVTVNVVPAISMGLCYEYGTTSGAYTAPTIPQTSVWKTTWHWEGSRITKAWRE